MDKKILALIQAGQERIRQEEEEQAYQELQEQESIKDAWDKFDQFLRPALPEVLRPYMVPSYTGTKDGKPEFVNFKMFHVMIHIHDLAPIKIQLALEDDVWIPVRIILPTEWSSEVDGEPYLSHTHAWEHYPIVDLDKALVSARELQRVYVERHANWTERQKARVEPQYSLIEPEQDCLRLLKEQIRTIIRNEMKEQIHA